MMRTLFLVRLIWLAGMVAMTNQATVQNPAEAEIVRIIGGLAGSDYRTALKFWKGEKVRGAMLNARLEEAKQQALRIVHERCKGGEA